MASALHKAIDDALAAPGYAERGILVNKLLEASSPMHVNEHVLYRAIYTIFRALPARLVPGTTLDIATADLPEGGIEIFWEAKETLAQGGEDARDLRHVLGHGPHGDLVEIALLGLERYCNMNAGYVDTYRERVASASSFDRPAYVVRRVLAVIPGASPTSATASQAERTERPPLDAMPRPRRSAQDGLRRAGIEAGRRAPRATQRPSRVGPLVR